MIDHEAIELGNARTRARACTAAVQLYMYMYMLSISPVEPSSPLPSLHCVPRHVHAEEDDRRQPQRSNRLVWSERRDVVRGGATRHRIRCSLELTVHVVVVRWGNSGAKNHAGVGVRLGATGTARAPTPSSTMPHLQWRTRSQPTTPAPCPGPSPAPSPPARTAQPAPRARC